jgi:hypothetical protein
MEDLSQVPDAELHRLIKVYSERRCGSCAYWMLKAHCKREETRIVSMNEYPCGKYELKEWYKSIISNYEDELVMRNI